MATATFYELRIRVKNARTIQGPPTAYKNKSKPRGACFIANWNKFSNRLSERTGSLHDVKNLETLFTQTGYWNVKKLEDSTREELLRSLKEFRDKEIKPEHDSFVGVFMSHGRENEISMSDGEHVHVADIYELFNDVDCPVLANKPKIFIFQHCRGDRHTNPSFQAELDNTDGRGFNQVGSNRGISDAFVIFSTRPRFVSYRNELTGGVFITELCKILMRNARDKDICELISQININLSNSEARQMGDLNMIGHKAKFYFNPVGVQNLGGKSPPQEDSSFFGIMSSIAQASRYLFPNRVLPSSSGLVSTSERTSYVSREHNKCRVCVINHLPGCEKELNDLSQKYIKFGYHVDHFKDVPTLQTLTEIITDLKEKSPCNILVLYYGYGYGDYVFVDQDNKESISYKHLCSLFALDKSSNFNTVVFTNICFKAKASYTTVIPFPNEFVDNTYHMLVKVNGTCAKGSLLTKALLELHKDEPEREFSTLTSCIGSRIKSLGGNSGDSYFTSVWYYGVVSPFYHRCLQESVDQLEEGDRVPRREETTRADIASLIREARSRPRP